MRGACSPELRGWSSLVPTTSASSLLPLHSGGLGWPLGLQQLLLLIQLLAERVGGQEDGRSRSQNEGLYSSSLQDRAPGSQPDSLPSEQVGLQPGLQAHQGGVQSPAVMVTSISLELPRKAWSPWPREPGTQKDVAMGKPTGVPGGPLEGRPQKGARLWPGRFLPVLASSRQCLLGLETLTKLGFGQAGGPPGGFGTDSWDVVFPALKSWGPEPGLEPLVTPPQQPHGVRAGWNALNGGFPGMGCVKGSGPGEHTSTCSLSQRGNTCLGPLGPEWVPLAGQPAGLEAPVSSWVGPVFPGVRPAGPRVSSGSIHGFFFASPRGPCHSYLDSSILTQTLCSAPRDNLCLALWGIHG